MAAFVTQAAPAHWHMFGPQLAHATLSCCMVFWHVLTQYSWEMELAITHQVWILCYWWNHCLCVRAATVTNLGVAFNSNVILCPVISFYRYVYFISLLIILLSQCHLKDIWYCRKMFTAKEKCTYRSENVEQEDKQNSGVSCSLENMLKF
jgi:hypothetical protein